MLVSLGLDQHIEDLALSVDGPPKVDHSAVDRMGVEPHDLETGPRLRVPPQSFSPSSRPSPPLPRERFRSRAGSCRCAATIGRHNSSTSTGDLLCPLYVDSGRLCLRPCQALSS